MMRPLVVALAALVALPASPAFADDVAQAFASAPAAAPLSDGALGAERGRLVLPAGAPSGAGTPALSTTRVAGAGTATVSDPTAPHAANAAPTSVGTAGGRVMYFGFQLSSQWTTHGPGGTATYTAAQTVGIDVSGAKPAVTIGAWTARSGNAASVPGNGTIAGSPADGRISGVGQTIQIAGNGNSVTNGATIDVTSVRPALVAAPAAGGSTCGAACSVSAGPQGVGVAIDLPGGSVSQGLAAGSLYQNVRVTSDGNAIANQMKMALQLAPGAFHAVSAPLNLIPPTLQLSH